MSKPQTLWRASVIPALLGTLLHGACAQTAPEAPAGPALAAPATTLPAPPVAKPDPTVPAPLATVWKDGNSWPKVHEGYVKRAAQGKVDLVFFGDSITQWWPWQDFKKRFEPLRGVNFGIGGDKTQNLLWRVQNGEMDGITPKVAVVLIGTNNLGNDPADKIAAAITQIVASIREKSPTTKVLLLGLFPRGWDANEQKWYRPKIQNINTSIARLDDGKNVRYADYGPQLLEADGTLSRKVAKDGLHLSDEGYRRWAEAMQGTLLEMMGLPVPPAESPTAPQPTP